MRAILFRIVACIFLTIPLAAQEREEYYVQETDPLVLAKLAQWQDKKKIGV